MCKCKPETEQNVYTIDFNSIVALDKKEAEAEAESCHCHNAS